MLGGASTIIVEIFKGALSTFLKAYDGKVNFAKTKIYGWNCPLRTLERIGRKLGFEVDA